MNRRLVGVSVVAALSGLFLIGSPCGGGGPSSQTFTANSIIIPMDDCYQAGPGGTPNQTVQCNDGKAGRAGSDQGVLRAYGLAYFLISHGITVYWTVNPNKTSFTGIDVTVDGGTTSNVVTHWDWSTGSWSSTYFAANTLGAINYLGGPFIVDGTQAAAVVDMLTDAGNPAYPDFAGFRKEHIVDLHQSSVGFTAQQVRPLVGPAPRVAIFDYTGNGSARTTYWCMTDMLVAEPFPV